MADATTETPAQAPTLQKSREDRLESLLEKAASTIEAQNAEIARMRSLMKESPPKQVTSHESSTDHKTSTSVADEIDTYPGKETAVSDQSEDVGTAGAFLAKRMAALEQKLDALLSKQTPAPAQPTVRVATPTPIAKAPEATKEPISIAGLVRKALEHNGDYLGGSESAAYEVDARIAKTLTTMEA